MKPEWCPQWARDRADFLKRVLPGEPLFQHHIELALVDAHQRGKDESQAEIARLNKVISRMQNTMSRQAEQWTRSMAEAKREGVEEAAGVCDAEIEQARQFGPHHIPIISGIRQAIHAKAQEVKT